VQRLKVLIIPEFLVTPFGGARDFFYKILDINYLQNIETAVILEHTKADEYVKKKCKENNSKIFIIHDRIGKFNIPIYSIFYEFFYYSTIIHRFHPDIILVSNIRPGINLSVLLFSYPIIFFVHSYPSSKVPFWHYYWAQLIAHFFSNKKKQFVSVSRYAVKQIIKHMKVPSKYTNLIYNSHPLCIKPHFRINLNNEVTVLTIGHVVSYKNPHIWLKVAEHTIKQDNSVKFIWVGDGPLLKKMRNLVNRSNLSKNIIFHGYSKDVASFYINATVYFQPSLSESHGIAVVEAMTYGLPCVVSNIGGLPESVINGKTGYICDPTDIKALSKKLLSFIHNPELASTFGKAGEKRALSFFNPLIQQIKILDLYNKILSS
jgi:glycosyltransferase involved in cell wall biosynthesis